MSRPTKRRRIDGFNWKDYAFDYPRARNDSPSDSKVLEFVGSTGQWTTTSYTTEGVVSGGGSFTDNRLVKTDGTGNIQQTGITIDDSDNVTGLGTVTMGGTSLTATGALTISTTGALVFSPSTTVQTTANFDFQSLANITNLVNLNGRSVSNFVINSGSSTDNALPKFDGTGGKTVQASSIIVDDSNNMTGRIIIVSVFFFHTDRTNCFACCF